MWQSKDAYVPLPSVASGSLSTEYLRPAKYMIGTPGTCKPKY